MKHECISLKASTASIILLNTSSCRSRVWLTARQPWWNWWKYSATFSSCSLQVKYTVEGKIDFYNGRSAGFTHQVASSVACCWTCFIWPHHNDSSPTRKPCNYVKHFYFDKVPIMMYYQECSIMWNAINVYRYISWVCNTHIVHCYIFSVLTGLRYRWDIVWNWI